MEQSLLYRSEYAINDNVHIMIPTVGEVIDKEDDYYRLVCLLTAMPIDMMVQLDDAGIDFTTIDEYELFLLLFAGMREEDTGMIFGQLDMSKFEPAANEQSGEIVLLDSEHDIVIDRAIHQRIAEVLRRIHHLEQDTRRPANEEAKEYMIERARIKQRRRRAKQESSQLEPLIVAMVNAGEFKYDYESVRNLSIFQFNESVRQVIKRVDYDKRMIGVYTGSINVKDLKKEDLTWFS